MKPFIDEAGAIPESLPRQVKKLIENLGIIIASVTEPPSASSRTVVFCWNKIKRKRCSGKIDAGIDVRSLNIMWHCLKCGDNGVIRNWGQTFWDNRPRDN
jgi:hypothetical protein